MNAILHVLQTALTQIGGFFNIPLFWFMLLFLAADLGSGIYRARVEKRYDPARAPKALYRGIKYVTIYVVIHAYALSFPPYDWFCQIVLAIQSAKEIISTMQNFKAVAVVLGVDAFELDLGIKFFGLERFQKQLDALVEKANPSQES